MRAGQSALVMLALSASTAASTNFDAGRRQMIEEINKLAASVAGDTGIDAISPRVLDALRDVPRHEFVPPAQQASAYRNRPLTIGHGQTISQPFIVALMTELLSVEPGHRILEVGTGSGYQAAILSKLAHKVYSIEIVRELGEQASEVLARFGFANVTTRIGDGYRGWPEHAPFDGIVVTAAPDHVPPALIEQLKPGGRLVIPVGGAGNQELMVVTRERDGTTVSTKVIPVRFVPLTRER